MTGSDPDHAGTDRPPMPAAERLGRIVEAHALLADVARQVGPALDLTSTLTGVLAAMRSLVSFRGGSICLVEADHVYVAAADPPVSPEVSRLRLPVGEGLAGRIVADGKVVYSPDLDADERVDPEVRDTGSNRGITSYLGVPLVSLGRVIGLMQVDSPDVDAFDEIDRTLLEGLGAQMANAIESARQFDEVMRLEGLKSSILTMISHELRTPLSIARGFVDVMNIPGAVEPEQHADLLGRTAAALDRMVDLVEDLILMSQIAGGEVEAKAEHVALGELITEAVKDSSNPAAVTCAPIPPVTVSSDERLLSKIVEELLDNALKYAGDAEIDVAVSGPTVIVSIRDHGPGIPEDLEGHEFDEFVRSDENQTTIAGLGLGLATASALGRMTGAQIQLDRAEGGGTLATVRLQLSDVEVPIDPALTGDDAE